MRKKILILGVSGQDGSLLAEFLLNKRITVYGLIRKSSNRNYSNLKKCLNNKRFKLVNGDILDYFSMEKIIREIKPDEYIILLIKTMFDGVFKYRLIHLT